MAPKAAQDVSHLTPVVPSSVYSVCFLLFLQPDFNVLEMCFEIFISFKFVLYQNWMQTAINLQGVYFNELILNIIVTDNDYQC